MQHRLYHLRRLTVSYIYEYLLLAVSSLLAITRQFYLVLYFAIACIGAGLAFTLYPAEMASIFRFENLHITALTDVRAYYGTMLVALGGGLIAMARTEAGARAALIAVMTFAGGSAVGRFIGFIDGENLLSIHGLLFPIEVIVTAISYRLYKRSVNARPVEDKPVLNPQKPEDFRPTSQANFEKPYAYYKMLRDDYPVYYMKDQGFYMISRYQDICDLTKDTEAMSNKRLWFNP